MKDKKFIVVLLNSFIPILIAFLIGGIIIAILGSNPFEAYGILLEKSLFSFKGFLNTLHYAAPLMLTGLAIAITFKANIYNMGVEGQLLLGGFFSGIVGAYMPNLGSSFLTKLICLCVGALVGVIFAMLPALLKVKCDVNIMVVTLMLNYAVLKFLEFLTTSIFRDKQAGYVATNTISKEAMFSRIGISRLTSFIIIALIVVVIGIIIMNKSKLGYNITAIGMNPEFAQATGIDLGKNIIILMAISGALSGLAGAGWMMTDQFKFTLSFSANPGLGWDGMLIALLGANSPIGILVASIFYAAIVTGSDSINLYTDVPKEIIAIIQGIMIILLAIKYVHDLKLKGFSFGVRRELKHEHS